MLATTRFPLRTGAIAVLLAATPFAAMPQTVATGATDGRQARFLFVNVDTVTKTPFEGLENLKDTLSVANKVVRSLADRADADLVLQQAVCVSPRVDVTAVLVSAMKQEQKGETPVPVVKAKPTRAGFVTLSGDIVSWARRNGLAREQLEKRLNGLVQPICQAEVLNLIIYDAVYASPRINVTGDVVAALEGRADLAQRIAERNLEPVVVGFVNLDRILRESVPAVQAQRRLEAEFSEPEKELQAMEDSLKHRQQALENTSTPLSGDDRARLTEELARQSRELSDKRRALVERFNKRRDEELKPIMNLANTAMLQVAKSRNLDLVFQEAVYANPRTEITQSIIELMK